MHRTTGARAARIGTALWVTGLSLMGAFWLATGITTTAIVGGYRNPNWRSAGEAWIPVVGPFVMLGDSNGYTGAQVGATVASAILQTISTGLFVTGLVIVATTSSGRETAIVPTPMDRGAGLSLVGRF